MKQLRARAYCRVSTKKEEQAESLKHQKEFFYTYTKEKNYKLTDIYAEKGKTGTNITKRKEFKKMMQDARNGEFDILLVKDISRFARNTVDFLNAIRELKALDIKVFFVSSGQSTMETDEFTLTILSAVAQQESENLSEKVKFGKNITAKRGRLPNFAYGYDRVNGTFIINKEEAKIIRDMHSMIQIDGLSTRKIADKLNEMNIKTKRGNKWHQQTVLTILKNPLYTGRVCNKKSEVINLFTQERKFNDKKDWIIVYRPEVRIIDDETYSKTLKILKKRRCKTFKNSKESTKYLFSNLIKCAECNYSFRRTKRKVGNNPNVGFWVCSKRNVYGADKCDNRIVISEDELEKYIKNFLLNLKDNYEDLVKAIINKLNKIINNENKERNINVEKLEKELEKIQDNKTDLIKMKFDKLINDEEFKKYMKKLNQKKDNIELDLLKSKNQTIIINNVINNIDNIKSIINKIDEVKLNNGLLKRIIDKITVDKNGKVKIYINVENDLDLDFTFCHNSPQRYDKMENIIKLIKKKIT